MSTEPESLEENKEPSPYIRTFAKDFAALAEKDPAAAAESKKQQKLPKPLKQKVATSTPDALEQEIDSRAAEMQKQGTAVLETPTVELTELPKIEEGDIVKAGAQPITTALHPIGGMIPTEMPKPAEQSEAERTAILERLKAKAASHIKTPEALTPEVATPTVMPVTPTPQSREQTPSPIHTYTSDFADQIDQTHANAFSVLAAEKDAPAKAYTEPKKNSNATLAVVAGIVLLLAGAGGVVAAYMYMNKSAPILISSGPTSLIVPDSRVKLTGTGSVLVDALIASTNGQLPENNILLTYEDVSSSTSFIDALNLPAPDILLRNIDASSMVGVVHAGTQTRPFFILRVTSYERTFAGMLAWEPTLFQNLSRLYPLYPSITSTTLAPTSISTTTKKTASSTPAQVFVPSVDTSAPATQFVDEVVANRSVRALKDNASRTLVLYGYADKQTLIIARNEDAFSLLVARLSTSGN